MRADGPAPEIPLPAEPRRVRRQRLLCLGLLPLLAAPLLLLSGRFAPVDRAAPVGLHSVTGAPSRTSTTAASGVPAALRRTTTTVPVTTTVPATTITSSTTTEAPAPEAKAAPAPTTAPPATAPPAAAEPTAVAPTTAPRPAPTTSTTTAPPTTTTAPPTIAAPPAPSPNRQSGQATWYRWKRGNCAHNALPRGTRVTVTAVATGRTATCVVGDRGAFRDPTIIDLDASVFEQIAPLGAGRIAVVISW